MEEVALFLLTVAIELPIAVFCLRRKAAWKTVALAAVFVNAVSHPIAWLLIGRLVNWYGVELGVAVFEAVVFALVFPYIRIRAALTAVFMNLVSAAVGYLMS